MRATCASVWRAVMPSGTRSAGSASRLRGEHRVEHVLLARARHARCGLGVMFGVMAREKLSQTSYCELASPIPGSSCGCVATTW